MKRLAFDEQSSNQDSQDCKRRRVDTTLEPIHNARQLQQLLTFDQNNIGALVTGIQSFKAFLDSLLYSTADKEHDAPPLAILRDLLDSSTRKRGQELTPFLPDLMQAWSYAAQTNNDTLMFSVSSIFALLLKTLSSHIDLRPHGSALCHAMLQRDQLKLLSRGVCAESHKERLISPCLRLLTEIISFDGGTFAARIFERQDFTFNIKFIDRNLRLSRPAADQDRRKSSIRSNTVRYLVANLRFQPLQNKVKIVAFRNLFRTLFDHLQHDPISIIRDVLKAIETHILQDQTIPRKLKSAILSDRSLAAILEVARTSPNTATDSDIEHQDTPASVVLAFLTRVCTTLNLGVLLPSSWYPIGVESRTDAVDHLISDDEAELDLPEPRNQILAKFLISLRPHSHLDERQLALNILKAAPELVAHYTTHLASTLPMDPKLTNTWIGFISFFYDMIDLAIPALDKDMDSGHSRQRPPSVSTMVENLLPSPLTQKVLVRCLNQSSDLITLMALRCMISSIKKLKSVLAMLSSASGTPAYEAAAKHLMAEYLQRFPRLKDITLASRKCLSSQSILEEAFFRLRAMCSEVLSSQSNDDGTDIAAALSSHILIATEHDMTDAAADPLSELQTRHLLTMAKHTIGSQWWQKQQSFLLTPFTSLLARYNQSYISESLKKDLRLLLRHVVAEHGILQQSTQIPAIDALLAILCPSQDFVPSTGAYSFVDECIGRLVKRPVAYLDQMDELTTFTPAKPLSLLAVVCMEQAPFTSRMGPKLQYECVQWLSRFLHALDQIGEDKTALAAIKKGIKSQDVKLVKVSVTIQAEAFQMEEPSLTATRTEPDAVQVDDQANGASVIFDLPVAESDNHPELSAFKSLDMTALIDDPDLLAKVVLCLCSQYPEVRRQAHVGLLEITTQLQTSNHENAPQIYLLLGELLETIKAEHIPLDKEPLPYLLGAFTTHSLAVLKDPSSTAYPLLNRFLLKDPSWKPRKMTEYWLNKTTLQLPDPEDAQLWDLVAWVLEWIVAGLRRDTDFGLVGARGGVERILSLASSPSLPRRVQDQISAFVWRALNLESSDASPISLLTGTGVLAWLETRLVGGKLEKSVLKRIVKRFRDKVRGDKVLDWSRGFVPGELERLAVLVEPAQEAKG